MQYNRPTLVLFLALLLLGCNRAQQRAQQPPNQPTPTDSPALMPVTPRPTVETVTVVIVTPDAATPTGIETASATLTPTPASTQAMQEVVAGSYLIDQSSRSEQGALQNVTLVLHTANLSEDAITLLVGFQNSSESGFELIGDGLRSSDVQLADEQGNSVQANQVDAVFDRLDPVDGFAPGGANVGTLQFPRLPGSGPYTFSISPGFGYQPITFELSRPLLETEVAGGSYAVDRALYSSLPILDQIALEVRQVTLDAQQIVFDVAFVNNGVRGLDLTGELTGMDAWLLDAYGRQIRPQAVSESLQQRIDPEGGWRAGEAHSGQIIFERPAALEQARFIFREFSPLTLRFDQTGLAAAEITSATGDAAPPTPTPRPAVVTRQELQALLDQQAQALLAGDAASYIRTFDPDLASAQEPIALRHADLPLDDLTLTLDPGVEFSGAEQSLTAAVEYSYDFAQIENNPFVYQWQYSFTKGEQGWFVSAVEPPQPLPYWYVDEFIVAQTDHFLLFLRPQDQDDLDALAGEVETAYAALAEKGLMLDQRYVAYLTSSQQEFEQVTGLNDSRLLGLASNRYLFGEDQIRATNRAFFINDEAFDGSSLERQTTVTHELVHLALGASTRPFTPPWLSEGAAVYYAGQLQPAAERLLDADALQALDLEALTGANMLGEHDATQVNAEYAFSGAVYAYLVEQFGDQAVLDFYRSYADVPVADIRAAVPGTFEGEEAAAALRNLGVRITSDQLAQRFDLTLTELDQQIDAWLLE